ncbi:hypothetical protein BCR33DRAFT_716909 [Rhizoclosmatium globosum]|uniref:Uncharacterized protein n=1 Tax=Rhizoclosmatium globosum TaxID=329046 RepID=A0A1Y2CBC6_9FUNG|nr:hypothetical protein BCR33DRAFT_716909 [Rhizoclosmatium globosum]|eukprot:ORY44351.1 hypothetical protein BCR33DRAFT_716909 [Rhizoclosmatium globosum]
MDKQTGLGHRQVLFDHAFGGAFSVFQYAGYQRYGEGLVLAELSHKATEYLEPKDPSRTGVDRRRITMTYIPKAQYAELEKRWETEESCPPDLETGKELAEQFKGLRGTYPAQFFLLILFTPKDVVSFHCSFMMNWTSGEEHWAHRAYTMEDVARHDWEVEVSPSIIGPKFYKQAMEDNERRAKAGGYAINGLDTGELIPPIAFNLMVTRIR